MTPQLREGPRIGSSLPVSSQPLKTGALSSTNFDGAASEGSERLATSATGETLQVCQARRVQAPLKQDDTLYSAGPGHRIALLKLIESFAL